MQREKAYQLKLDAKKLPISRRFQLLRKGKKGLTFLMGQIDMCGFPKSVAAIVVQFIPPSRSCSICSSETMLAGQPNRPKFIFHSCAIETSSTTLELIT